MTAQCAYLYRDIQAKIKLLRLHYINSFLKLRTSAHPGLNGPEEFLLLSRPFRIGAGNLGIGLNQS